MSVKQEKRNRIHTRIRTTMFGTADRPRLNVFKSGNHIYAQLIDDQTAKVLVSVSDLKMKTKGTKTVRSMEVGKQIAKAALEKNIDRVVFDRGGFTFHGRVKAVADGAREAGLKF